MTIPTLRFKADDSSKFGEWKSIQLKDIAERIARKNKEENQNALTISAQMGLVNQQAYFSKQIASRDLSKYYLLHKGEYAYNKSYSAGYPMGAIKRLKLYEKGVVSTLYICFSLNKQVNSDFFEQYVESGNLVPELEKIAQEGARNHGLLNISLQEFFEINLIVPCLKEQMKIATFLSAVDKKISQLSQKLHLLEQYKQGMMQKIFSQQIRFKAHDGSEFGGWEEKKLGSVCQRNYQGINTVADKVEYQQHGYPILQAKHMTSEKLDFEDVRYLSDSDYEKYKDKYIPQLNDILFSNIGTIGKVVLVDESKSFFIAWNIFLMSIKLRVANPSYITAYLRWLTSLNYFDNLQTGNATKFINKTDLLDTKVNLPCLEEQSKIANFLSAIDQKINVVSGQIEQAKLWKKGLLQQMFV